MHEGMASRIRNKGSGSSQQELLIEDADVERAHDGSGFRERLHQLARFGSGGWPACKGGETEVVRFGGAQGFDRRRLGRLERTRDGWRSAGRGDESGASWCHDRYNARSAEITQTTASAMIARADRRLRRTLVRAGSMPLSCMAMVSPAFNPDEAGGGAVGFRKG